MTPSDRRYRELVITGRDGSAGPHELPASKLRSGADRRVSPYLTALWAGVLRVKVVENGAAGRLELACSEGALQALPAR